jgi:uncharacterized protein (TIGR02594 family)
LDPVHNPKPKFFRNERLLAFAAGEIGVKERPGSANNPQIVKYHAYATVANEKGDPDSVPWCASFLAYCLEAGAGMGSTNMKNARSYLKWGVSVKDNPIPGDIVVFWRGQKNGWKGHVGILVELKVTGEMYILGGNQSDQVNVRLFNPNQLLDIRRSSKMHELSDEELTRLTELATKVKYGGKIELATQLA